MQFGGAERTKLPQASGEACPWECCLRPAPVEEAKAFQAQGRAGQRLEGDGARVGSPGAQCGLGVRVVGSDPS